MGRTRKIELSTGSRSQRIVLPVNPEELTVTMPQLNEKVTLLRFGAANIPGKRDLVTISWESFFPGRDSPFCHYARMTPKKYLRRIKAWKDAGRVVRVIITDMGINLQMLIDSFEPVIREGQKDLSYTISLSEYRRLNVPAVSITKQTTEATGLKERPAAPAPPARTYTVKRGDCLWNIAKRFYGSGASFSKIYEANRGVIGNDANKIKAGQVFVIP